ncbi:hypothetical protein [Halosegnis marinus]|uniref:DUF8106 domain-containing protein n=1 Tax=Halosegnis marinus TaxID=3034023 RepID=A0ABD5ZL49_9EURY|nr:hypothetical protein [Halosegnis sp. DT85]
MSPAGPPLPDSDDEPPSTAAKMSLFCAECGHRSELGGDWLVREGEAGYRIVCPECATVIVAQPVFGMLA